MGRDRVGYCSLLRKSAVLLLFKQTQFTTKTREGENVGRKVYQKHGQKSYHHNNGHAALGRAFARYFRCAMTPDIHNAGDCSSGTARNVNNGRILPGLAEPLVRGSSSISHRHAVKFLRGSGCMADDFKFDKMVIQAPSAKRRASAFPEKR